MAAWFLAGGLIQEDSLGKASWQLTALAGRRTTTFTCWPRAHRAANATDVMFARSTDGGLTFSARNGSTTIREPKQMALVRHTRSRAERTALMRSGSTREMQLITPTRKCSIPLAPMAASLGHRMCREQSVQSVRRLSEPEQDRRLHYDRVRRTGGNVAYSATFNFNPNLAQHEEDIYYVRVFPSGGPTPTRLTATATATATHSDTYSTPRPTPTPRPVPTPRACPTPGLGRRSVVTKFPRTILD